MLNRGGARKHSLNRIVFSDAAGRISSVATRAVGVLRGEPSSEARDQGRQQ